MVTPCRYALGVSCVVLGHQRSLSGVRGTPFFFANAFDLALVAMAAAAPTLLLLVAAWRGVRSVFFEAFEFGGVHGDTLLRAGMRSASALARISMIVPMVWSCSMRHSSHVERMIGIVSRAK